MRTRLNVATIVILVALVGLRIASAEGEFMLIYTEQGGAKRVYKSGAELEMLSGATLDVQSGSTVTLAGTNTLSGTTTISGALTASGGYTVPTAKTGTYNAGASLDHSGVARIKSGATLQVQSGGALHVSSGATQTVTGTLDVGSGGTLNVASGGTAQVPTGGTLNVSGTQTIQSGGVLNTASGGLQTIQSGGTLTGATGSTVNVSGTGAIWGTTSVKQGGALVFDAGAKVVYNFQSKAANYTVLASESGTTFVATAVDVEFILPATAAGLTYTFVFKAPSGGTGGQVSPVAADKIMGDGFTSADDKAAINTGATDREGDSITVVADGVDGWFIVSKSGTWAREG